MLCAFLFIRFPSDCDGFKADEPVVWRSFRHSILPKTVRSMFPHSLGVTCLSNCGPPLQVLGLVWFVVQKEQTRMLLLKMEVSVMEQPVMVKEMVLLVVAEELLVQPVLVLELFVVHKDLLVVVAVAVVASSASIACTLHTASSLLY